MQFVIIELVTFTIKNQQVSSIVKILLTVRKDWGSILGTDDSDTLSPGARYCCHLFWSCVAQAL